jgi:hypothetical protein
VGYLSGELVKRRNKLRALEGDRREVAAAATTQTRDRPRTRQYQLHKRFTRHDITAQPLARVPPSHLNTWQIGD